MKTTKVINMLGCAQVSSHRKKNQVNLESTKTNPSLAFYNSHDQSKATAAASISMLDAKYNNNAMKLNKQEKVSLVRFLEAPAETIGFDNLNNWQRAIVLFNQQFINMNIDWTKFTMRHKKRNANKWKFNKFKFALPIDMPMPDYSQL